MTFLRFNVVNLLGAGVQLAIVALLAGVCGVHYLVATAIAIEAAILHNFFWHVRWTWAVRAAADGEPPAPVRGHLAFRCVAFHAGNGLVSMVGSMVLLPVLVGGVRLHYLVANLVAICCTGLLNFLLADRLVFADIWRRM
jgi:putative flippase GtrA